MPLIDLLVDPHGLATEAIGPVLEWGERLRRRSERQRIEFAATLDADTGAQFGGVLHGDAAGVDVDAHVRLMRPGRTYVALHTHPASSSFSDLDVGTFLRVEAIRLMAVVGVDGTWYLLSRRPGAAVPNPVEAAERLRAEVVRLLPWYRAQVQ